MLKSFITFMYIVFALGNLYFVFDGKQTPFDIISLLVAAYMVFGAIRNETRHYD